MADRGLVLFVTSACGGLLSDMRFYFGLTAYFPVLALGILGKGAVSVEVAPMLDDCLATYQTNELACPTNED